uniref:Uncharacterized protein n=1 Tax=Rhizophora mucronata TaxID=61149 RepID=A0A2P2QC29_RHIMU
MQKGRPLSKDKHNYWHQFVRKKQYDSQFKRHDIMTNHHTWLQDNDFHAGWIGIQIQMIRKL